MYARDIPPPSLLCVIFGYCMPQLLGSETAKASLLFSMEQEVVQGWVGLDPAEEASLLLRNKKSQQVGVEETRCWRFTSYVYFIFHFGRPVGRQSLMTQSYCCGGRGSCHSESLHSCLLV